MIKMIFILYNMFLYLKKKKKKVDLMKLDEAGIISASSIWCTFNAMEEVNRPEIESNWRQFFSRSALHGRRERASDFAMAGQSVARKIMWLPCGLETPMVKEDRD
jgi:hypothetical protein